MHSSSLRTSRSTSTTETSPMVSVATMTAWYLLIRSCSSRALIFMMSVEKSFFLLRSGMEQLKP